MQTPGSRFDAANERWVWEYEGEELPLDKGATVRFHVREVSFRSLDDAKPPDPVPEGARITHGC
jgi:DNA-directed RNA polymerase subunit E'/Rpb7